MHHNEAVSEVLETDRPMTHEELAQLKTYKFTFCCLMEDFVQSGVQLIVFFILNEKLVNPVNSVTCSSFTLKSI